MITAKIPLFLFSLLLIFSLTFSPVLAQEPQPSSLVTPDVIVPTPNYPNLDDVKTKTPTFYFSEVETAWLYSMQVYEKNSGNFVYKVKGDGDCEFSICTFTPDQALKIYNISGTKGEYYWQIRAKVGDTWSDYSTPAIFRVLSNGFESTFTTDMNKWLPVAGIWKTTTAGYLKGVGVVDHEASVVQKQLFTEGFAYEVKMKRKYESDTPNRVYFLGYPYTNEGGVRADGWDDGYIFEYTNDGFWGLRKRVDGLQTTLLPESGTWQLSTSILPNEWNTLTVYVDGDDIHLWINMEYLGAYVAPAVLSEGYIGIGLYEGDTLSSPLLVDEAWLEYWKESPYPIP